MSERGRPLHRDRLLHHLDSAIQHLGDTFASKDTLVQLNEVYQELQQARDYAERIDADPRNAA